MTFGVTFSMAWEQHFLNRLNPSPKLHQCFWSENIPRCKVQKKKKIPLSSCWGQHLLGFGSLMLLLELKWLKDMTRFSRVLGFRSGVKTCAAWLRLREHFSAPDKPKANAAMSERGQTQMETRGPPAERWRALQWDWLTLTQKAST